jgi:hypothetical protein
MLTQKEKGISKKKGIQTFRKVCSAPRFAIMYIAITMATKTT